MLRLFDGIRELRVHGGVDGTVRFYFVVHLVMDERAGVLIREGFALAVRALRAHVGTVGHLICLGKNPHKRKKIRYYSYKVSLHVGGS